MASAAPRVRRRFDSVREEADYLYHKLLYWFYERKLPNKARPYAARLEKLLGQEYSHTIFAQECWSLIFELQGDLARAIKHRRQEIKLIRKLFALAKTPDQRRAALAFYDFRDLSDRLDLLATLYYERGNLAKAMEAICESKALCRRHGVPFDGQDVLEEIEAGLKAARAEKNGAF